MRQVLKGYGRRCGRTEVLVLGAAVCLLLGVICGILGQRYIAAKQSRTVVAPNDGKSITSEVAVSDAEPAETTGTRGATSTIEVGLSDRTYYRSTAAVLIGIDAYGREGSNLPPLQFAVNDARELRDLLRDEFGYVEDRVRYLSDSDATRTNIEAAFTSWLPQKQLTSDDAVLVFFAGHGLIDAADSEGYLAAVDSTATDFSTCVAVKWLRDQLESLPCRHKLVLLDSCYSGSLFRQDRRSVTLAQNLPLAMNDTATRSLPNNQPPSATTIAQATNLGYYLGHPAFFGMSAGRSTPVVDGNEKDQHSVFTLALLQELRDRADSNRHQDYQFTFRQLAARIEARVANAPSSIQIPDWGRLGEGDGDFVFRPTYRRLPESVQRKIKAHNQLVRLHESNGFRLMDSGDLPGALLWFAEAIKLDADTASTDSELPHVIEWEEDRSRRDEMSRVRLGAIQHLCLSLSQTLFCDGELRFAEFRSDGKRILTGAFGAVRQWDVRTGNPVGQPIRVEGMMNVRGTYSPDGKSFVTAHGMDNDARLQVWNSNTGEPKSEPVTVTGSIQQVTFSADGTRIAARTVVPPASGEVAILDAQTLRPLRAPITNTPAPPDLSNLGDAAIDLAALEQLTGGVSFAYHAAFSPDSDEITTAWQDGTFLISATDAATPPRLTLKHEFVGAHASYSRDGNKIATAGHWARVWSAASGEPLAKWMEHDGNVVRVVFSPDGHLVATATSRETTWVGLRTAEARVWSTETGEAITPRLAHDGSITALAFSPDGKLLLTAAEDNRARIWDVTTGQQRLADMRHGASITHGEFSPDGKLVLTASDDGTVRVWDLYSMNQGTSIAAGTTLAAVSGDGSRLVCHDFANKSLEVISTETGESLSRWNSDVAPGARAVFSPSGQHVLVASTDYTTLTTAVEIKDLKTEKSLELDHPGMLNLMGAEFSPDGKYLATAGMCQKLDLTRGEIETWGEARIWEVNSGKLWSDAPHKRANAPVSVATFSPDSSEIMVASMDGVVSVQDLDTGKRKFTNNELAVIQFAKFSPDGNRIVAVDAATVNAVVLDATTGSILQSFTEHQNAIQGIAFSDDSRRVLTFDLDGIARVWDIATSTSKTPPLRHEGAIRDAVFDKTGRLIATAASDHTARIWDAESGKPVTPALRHKLTEVSRVQFSLDGQSLFTTNLANHRRWAIRPELRNVEDFRPELEWLAAERIDETRDLVELKWEQSPNQLSRLAVTQPENWWLRFRIGLSQAEQGDSVSARLSFTNAIELGAGDQDVWENRASVLINLGEHTAAINDYRQARGKGADSSGFWSGLARAFRETGDFVRAAKASSTLIERIPYLDSNWSARGFCYASTGDWANAETDYQEAIRRGSSEAWTWYQLALVQLAAGDVASYHATCQDILDKFGNSQNAADAYWVAWTWSLGVATKLDNTIVQLARDAVRDGPAEMQPAYLTCLAAVLYRAEIYDEALQQLDRANVAFQKLASSGGDTDLSSMLYTKFYLAMTLARLNNREQAKTLLTEAQAQMSRVLGSAKPGEVAWNRELTLERLDREARASLSNVDL